MNEKTKELGDKIKSKRTEMGWSLRDVSEATGVSASTLSRIEGGIGRPDADNIAAISGWLGHSAADIVGAEAGEPVIYYPTKPTPDIVQEFLDKDDTLTPEVRVALGELFRVAYGQFSKRK